MKKNIIKLGIFSLSIIPIGFLVSCNENNENSKPKNKIKTKIITKVNDITKDKKDNILKLPIKSIDPPNKEKPTNVVPKKLKKIKLNKSLKRTFGEIHNIKKDGFYLYKNDYFEGKIWNNDTLKDGKPSTKDVEMIKEAKGYALNPAVMLGNDDSFYMVFNKDDNDGLKPADFFTKIFFNDSSVMSSKVIKKINKHLGNSEKKSSFWSYDIMPFVANNNEKTKGELNPYVGSQSNHSQLDIQDALKTIVNLYSPKTSQSILKYYGFKTTTNAQGIYEDDPTINNHANRGFVPLAQSKQVFSFTKIDDRTFKITTHVEKGFSITAAHFLIKQNDNKYKKIGSFSIGDQKEWVSYTKHKNAKYIAIKDVFLKNN